MNEKERGKMHARDRENETDEWEGETGREIATRREKERKKERKENERTISSLFRSRLMVETRHV